MNIHVTCTFALPVNFVHQYFAKFNVFFVQLMCQQMRKNIFQDGWNNMVPGGIAGLTLFIESQNRRKTVALFAIARACGALANTLVTRKILSPIPYGSTWLFCICCAFLLHSVALKPQLLMSGYYYSVLKWSRDYTDKKLKILFRDHSSKFLSCSEVGLHPDSCSYHAVRDWLQSWPGFAKLYMSIHIAPVILFRRKLVMER